MTLDHLAILFPQWITAWPAPAPLSYQASLDLLRLVGATTLDGCQLFQIPAVINRWAWRVPIDHVQRALTESTDELLTALPWDTLALNNAELLIRGVMCFCGERGFGFDEVADGGFAALDAAIAAQRTALLRHEARLDVGRP